QTRGASTPLFLRFDRSSDVAESRSSVLPTLVRFVTAGSGNSSVEYSAYFIRSALHICCFFFFMKMILVCLLITNV
ncbi:hypothetical protein L9F63_026857, partial [Diploptera punctata]